MKIGLILLVLGCLGILAGWWWWTTNLQPTDSTNTQKIAFVIQKGESTSGIAQDLKDKGLIRSPFLFKVYLKLSHKAGNLQAGDFALSPSMSVSQIIEQLSIGVLDKWVTLIEGWRVEEEAQELQKQLQISPDEFIQSAQEGYMFPDTYLFNKDVALSDIVSRLKNTFDLKYTQELRDQIKKKGLTEEQGVILASIVEREGRSDEVRTQIASILLKRLKIDMGLNADATIQYALGYQPQEKSWWKKQLTRDDLKVVSPYNTYIHKGLPPTPICNPSVSSLEAVANASSNTPYLYYYHDSQGNSYYAKTLDEHNQNVAKYQ